MLEGGQERGLGMRVGFAVGIRAGHFMGEVTGIEGQMPAGLRIPREVGKLQRQDARALQDGRPRP